MVPSPPDSAPWGLAALAGRPWALSAVIVVAVAALYGPFLGVPFEYDDKVEIVTNQVLREPGNVGAVARYNPFRVLLMYTFAWDLWAWGFRPWGYRLENILLHAGNAVAVAELARRLVARLDLRAALLPAAAGLLFALHPLAIESVTYVSGRSSSLATGFVLLACLAWTRRWTLLDDPTIAWMAIDTARRTRALAALLGLGIVVGVPLGLAVRQGGLSASRAGSYALAALGVAAVLGAATLGERWRRLAAPSPQIERSARQVRATTALAFLFFVLGAATKEIAATLPGILLLLEATARRSWKDGLAQLRGPLFAFFGIPALLVLLRVTTYGYVASPEHLRPWTHNLLTQFEVVGRYAGLWVLPYPQSIYHDHPVVLPPGTPTTWLAAAGLFATIAWALRATRRRPLAAFAILFVVGTLAPTSSFFALKETMVEHRTYLPSVGWAVGFGALVEAVARRWGARLAVVGTAAVLVTYSVLHVGYDSLWRSEEVLWSHAVATNPDASDAWRNLGDLYLEQGRWPDAQQALHRGIEARPSNLEARNKLGVALALSGDVAGAAREFEAVLVRNECFAPALNNLAMARRQGGRAREAVDLYDRSLQCQADNPKAHQGLGDIYADDIPDRARAAAHYEEALKQMDPYSPVAKQLKQRLLDLTW